MKIFNCAEKKTKLLQLYFKPQTPACNLLSWALGQTDDPEKVKEIMLTPIVGEITEREPSNGYLIYQGGLPEVEEFIKQFRK